MREIQDGRRWNDFVWQLHLLSLMKSDKGVQVILCFGIRILYSCNVGITDREG
jgi:hypothetical protein